MEPVSRLQRLFFGLWPDETVRGHLANLTVGIGRNAGRIVAASNLHVTLLFLGGLDASRRRCVEQAADGVSAAPFTLHFDHCGSWPRPRVAWVGASIVPSELTALYAALAAAVSGCGMDVEARPYAPHVTLLRDARRAVPADPPVPIRWDVCGFTLIESRSDAASTHYSVLRSWQFCRA